MKKLMFSAAVAAMASGAFAVNTPEVYEMSMTIKTTACKVGQSKNVCDFDIDTYRVKATQTVKGLFWGCDCPTIAEPVAFTTFDVYGTEDSSHGYVFWNAKDKTPFGTANFAWEFLQCINAKMTEVEGTWDLVLNDLNDNEVVNIRGAGMGSAKWNKDYMAAYISSMSGNLAGAAMPGALSFGCAACGGLTEGCAAWKFCTECEEVDVDAFSTAYGTWTLKFNSSAAKKYAQKSILDSYKFSDAVKAYLVAVDAGGEEPDPSKERQAKAVANYKKVLSDIAANDELQKDLKKGKDDCAQGKEIKDNLENAKKDAGKTTADLTTAEGKMTAGVLKDYLDDCKAIDTANAKIIAAQKDLEEATTQKQIDDAKKDIEAGELELDNAKIAKANALKAITTDADKKVVAEYDAAKAADDAAQAAKDEAQKVQDAWDDKTKDKDGNYKAGSYEKAKVDADEAGKALKDAKELATYECVASGAQCF